MTAETLPTIFDPFVQETQSIDRAKGGLGLGLAIATRRCQSWRSSTSACQA